MLKKSGLAIILMMVGIIAAQAQSINTLTDTEKKQGWVLLFNGKTPAGWHTYNKKTFGPAWKITEGALACDSNYKVPKGEEGDICTDKVYTNFDFKYQWKISKNGNSGVMF